MGYTGHNILLTNWDQSNMDNLSFNDVVVYSPEQDAYAWQALMNGGYSLSWDVVDHHKC